MFNYKKYIEIIKTKSPSKFFEKQSSLYITKQSNSQILYGESPEKIKKGILCALEKKGD